MKCLAHSPGALALLVVPRAHHAWFHGMVQLVFGGHSSCTRLPGVGDRVGGGWGSSTEEDKKSRSRTKSLRWGRFEVLRLGAVQRRRNAPSTGGLVAEKSTKGQSSEVFTGLDSLGTSHECQATPDSKCMERCERIASHCFASLGALLGADIGHMHVSSNVRSKPLHVRSNHCNISPRGTSLAEYGISTLLGGPHCARWWNMHSTVCFRPESVSSFCMASSQCMMFKTRQFKASDLPTPTPRIHTSRESDALHRWQPQPGWSRGFEVATGLV